MRRGVRVPRMAWGRRGAALVIVGALVAGCGGASPSSEPTASASATPTPTPSAGPTESPTDEPSGVPTAIPTAIPTAPPAERTAVGAQAFVRYYVDVVNRAFATGETAALKKRSAKDCKTCANWLYNITQVYGAGGRISGGQIRVDSSSAAAPTQTASVDVTALVSEEIDLDAKGKALHTFPEAKGLLVFALAWVDGGWQVAEVRIGGTR